MSSLAAFLSDTFFGRLPLDTRLIIYSYWLGSKNWAPLKTEDLTEALQDAFIHEGRTICNHGLGHHYEKQVELAVMRRQLIQFLYADINMAIRVGVLNLGHVATPSRVLDVPSNP